MPVLICLRKELWTGLISVGDQVPTCPVFTRAKNKVPFWDFRQFRRHIIHWLKSCTTTKGFKFWVISWLVIMISLKSVLELINFGRNGQVQDTGWQSSGGKAAKSALSLLAMEPAIGLLFLHRGLLLWGSRPQIIWFRLASQ